MKTHHAAIDHVRLFVRQTQLWSVVLGTGLGVAMTVLSKPAGCGFLSGIALSMVNFWLMSFDVFEPAMIDPGKLVPVRIWRLILRFSAIFGVLALIAVKTSFNMVGVFAGLLFVQAIVVAGQVIRGLRALVNTPRI